MSAVEKQFGENSGNPEGTSNIVNLPVAKRPRGRPRGSTNRVSRDAKALLAQHAPAAIRAVCRLAAGLPISLRGPDGSRRVLVPDIDQMLSATRIVVDRLIPAAKASEPAPGRSPLDGMTTEQLVAALATVEKAIAVAGSQDT